jgi:hypothetical protein
MGCYGRVHLPEVHMSRLHNIIKWEDDVLGRKWQEMAVADLMYSPKICLEEVRKTHKLKSG